MFKGQEREGAAMHCSARRMLVIVGVLCWWVPDHAFAQQPEFNPYRELASIKRFVFVNGYYDTAGSEKTFDTSERELKNIVILKLRAYLKDVQYVDLPSDQQLIQQKELTANKDGRIACGVMSVDNGTFVAYHTSCSVGFIFGSQIWENATIALVSKRTARNDLRGTIDRLGEQFAGEYYRAKAQAGNQ
jgi:hypothetical protein